MFTVAVDHSAHRYCVLPSDIAKSFGGVFEPNGDEANPLMVLDQTHGLLGAMAIIERHARDEGWEGYTIEVKCPLHAGVR